MLIDLMEKSFRYPLTHRKRRNEYHRSQMKLSNLLKDELNIHFPEGMNFFSLEDKRGIIVDKLNRPIRICGMVKNEGEPGGGPFWVTDSIGNTTLQVVESSQIDLNDSAQQSIVEQATHFNPVDLVCSLKDYKGNNSISKNLSTPNRFYFNKIKRWPRTESTGTARAVERCYGTLDHRISWKFHRNL